MITFSRPRFRLITHTRSIIVYAHKGIFKNKDICGKCTLINATKQGLFILLHIVENSYLCKNLILWKKNIFLL